MNNITAFIDKTKGKIRKQENVYAFMKEKIAFMLDEQSDLAKMIFALIDWLNERIECHSLEMICYADLFLYVDDRSKVRKEDVDRYEHNAKELSILTQAQMVLSNIYTDEKKLMSVKSFIEQIYNIHYCEYLECYVSNHNEGDNNDSNR